MDKDGKYVAVYDVTEDRERTRIAKILQGFGFRVQKSVFEIRLTKASKETLKKRLEELNLESGCVFLYRLNENSKRINVGKVPELEQDEGYAFIA